MANGPQCAIIPEQDRISPLPERAEENTNDKSPPDIQLLGATAFVDRSASQEVVKAFEL